MTYDSFKGAVSGNDHYLMIAKGREKLSNEMSKAEF
jgi:hypothetical protein